MHCSRWSVGYKHNSLGDVPPGLQWINRRGKWAIKFDIKGKREQLGAIWKEEEKAAAITALERASAKYSEVKHLIDDTNRKRYVGMIKDTAKPLEEGRKMCDHCRTKKAGRNRDFCSNKGCREDRKNGKL